LRCAGDHDGTTQLSLQVVGTTELQGGRTEIIPKDGPKKDDT